MSDDSAFEPNDDEVEDRQLVLGDLLNHVLDKGVVISGDVIISIADIDLLSVDLKLVLSSVQTALEHHHSRPDADVSLLRSRSNER
jgi:gas vesicle structural protein